MKPDVEALFRQLIALARVERRSVRDVIADMKAKGIIQSEKQAWRTLEKWNRKGKYSYGVTLDLGWLEGETK